MEKIDLLVEGFSKSHLKSIIIKKEWIEWNSGINNLLEIVYKTPKTMFAIIPTETTSNYSTIKFILTN